MARNHSTGRPPSAQAVAPAETPADNNKPGALPSDLDEFLVPIHRSSNTGSSGTASR